MFERLTTPGFQDDRYKERIRYLAKRRKQLGMSQQELAAKLGPKGLHKQFVSRVELGERRLDFVEMVDYVRALDLDLAEFVLSIPRP